MSGELEASSSKQSSDLTPTPETKDQPQVEEEQLEVQSPP